MTRLRVAVVDYGAGNMVSIARALETVGVTATVVTEPAGLRGADALVVPGVGAAAPAMARLQQAGLVEPIRAWIADGRPFLGICLGLQLLYEGSDEDGAATLGVLAGRTVLLRDAPTLPHIGWNQVEHRRAHPIVAGIPDGSDLYFVHSFVVAPTDPTTIVAETTHGTAFPSVVASANVIGVQFHPERSGADGLRILADFARIASTGAPDGSALPIASGDRPDAPSPSLVGGDR